MEPIKDSAFYESGSSGSSKNTGEKQRTAGKSLDAKGLLCYWAARELKMPLADLARQLDMTVSGVGYTVQRGESIALRYSYRMLEKVI